ncbi:MAG: hypothetical protein LBD35_00835 [Prevotellaceae bacterium]|nr:hypothetical protein [Prevotellaceae bacterium]
MALLLVRLERGAATAAAQTMCRAACGTASDEVQTEMEFNSLISEINEATGENNTVGVETALLAKRTANAEGKCFVAALETEMLDGDSRPGGSGLIASSFIVSNTPLFTAAAVVRSAGGAPLAGDDCPGFGYPTPSAVVLRSINDTVYFKIVPDTPNKLRTNICSPTRGGAAHEPSARFVEGSRAEMSESRFESIDNSLYHLINNSVTHVNIDAEFVSDARSCLVPPVLFAGIQSETDCAASAGTPVNEYGSLYFNIIIVFDTLNLVRDELLSACGDEKPRPVCLSDARERSRDIQKKFIILTCKGQAQTSSATPEQNPALRLDVESALLSSSKAIVHNEILTICPEKLIVLNHISTRKGQAQTSSASSDNYPALRLDVVGARAANVPFRTGECLVFINIIRKGQAQTSSATPDNYPALRFDVTGALSSRSDEVLVLNIISTSKVQAQTPFASPDTYPALRSGVTRAHYAASSDEALALDEILVLNNISTRKGQAQTPSASPDKHPALRFGVVGAPLSAGYLTAVNNDEFTVVNNFKCIDPSFVYTGMPQAPSAYAGSMPRKVGGAPVEARATIGRLQLADPLNYVNTLGNPITGKVGGAHTDASASYRTYATITHHDANYVSDTDVVLNDITPDYFAELRSNLLRVCDDRLLPPPSNVIRDNLSAPDSRADRLPLSITCGSSRTGADNCPFSGATSARVAAKHAADLFDCPELHFGQQDFHILKAVGNARPNPETVGTAGRRCGSMQQLSGEIKKLFEESSKVISAVKKDACGKADFAAFPRGHLERSMNNCFFYTK